MPENNFEKQFDRLPMELRLPFQKEVFTRLGIENDVGKVLTDGEIISDFIDDVRNVEIRELIKSRKFEEAAEVMIKEIRKAENLQAAA